MPHGRSASRPVRSSARRIPSAAGANLNALRLGPSAAVMLSVLLVAGCDAKKVSSSVKKTADRSRRLTVLAASEAGNIVDADARLTRQLNIAEQVLLRFS